MKPRSARRATTSTRLDRRRRRRRRWLRAPPRPRGRAAACHAAVPDTRAMSTSSGTSAPRVRGVRAARAPRVGPGRRSGGVVRVERIEVFGDAARGGDLSMIGTRGHQALGRLRRVEVVPFVAGALQQLVAHHHQSLVRPVSLVEREQVHVGPEAATSGRPCGAQATPSTTVMTPAARARAVMRAMGLMSATTFEACGNASTRVRSLSSVSSCDSFRRPLSGSTRHSLTTRPSAARRRQQPLLASWSWSVTMTSSPALSSARRPRQHVGVLRGRRAELNLAVA